jgi:hypothetical protein
MTVRFDFIRNFIQSLLVCFLEYLLNDNSIITSCRNEILRSVTTLLLGRKSNLRSISWYLIQLVHSNDLIPRANHLISKIKTGKLSEQIDEDILRHHIQKKVEQLPEEDRPKEEFTSELNDQDFFNHEFQIIVPIFSDESICMKFLEEFQEKKIDTMRRLLKAVKRFSKLLTISHSKKLYYPIDLLGILEDWISRNFGMIEIEFQINILRMLVGNLEDCKILIHLLMLENFSKAEKENHLMQLFKNTMTVDIEVSKKKPLSL